MKRQELLEQILGSDDIESKENTIAIINNLPADIKNRCEPWLKAFTENMYESLPISARKSLSSYDYKKTPDDQFLPLYNNSLNECQQQAYLVIDCINKIVKVYNEEYCGYPYALAFKISNYLSAKEVNSLKEDICLLMESLHEALFYTVNQEDELIIYYNVCDHIQRLCDQYSEVGYT